MVQILGLGTGGWGFGVDAERTYLDPHNLSLWLGLRVWVSGFGTGSLGFKVLDLGLGFQGLGLKVQGKRGFLHIAQCVWG